MVGIFSFKKCPNNINFKKPTIKYHHLGLWTINSIISELSLSLRVLESICPFILQLAIFYLSLFQVAWRQHITSSHYKDHPSNIAARCFITSMTSVYFKESQRCNCGGANVLNEIMYRNIPTQCTVICNEVLFFILSKTLKLSCAW